jgi:hypothetical protein
MDVLGEEVKDFQLKLEAILKKFLEQGSRPPDIDTLGEER